MAGERLLDLAERLFRLLSSLKLAVAVVLALAVSLAAGTIVESTTDTPTAQYWVYHASWFRGLLAVLGSEIICVAFSRWPWQKRHTAFLLAHLGIVLLLAGSWITDRYGVDGNLRISEGETGSVVEMTQPELLISDAANVTQVPVPWVPPNASFRPFDIRSYGIRVAEFIAHADPNVAFAAAPPDAAGRRLAPAIRLRMTGGPMRVRQEFWLWGGDMNWTTAQLGPARFSLISSGSDALPAMLGAAGPSLTFTPAADGGLLYVSQNSEGSSRNGRLSAGKVRGSAIDPGWKGGVKLEVLEYLPRAVSNISYVRSRMDYGQAAPPSAIRVTAGTGVGGAEASVWLGLGDRAVLTVNAGQRDQREVGLAYFPQRVVLPFGIHLERFSIERYEGSHDPKAYASRVRVADDLPARPAGEIEISMNEPLSYRGFTLYQASYEEADPRPVTTILSVNRDPGRPFKYAGSLLIVLGSILLFAKHYRRKSKAPQTRTTPLPAKEASL
jgi:hypothetical protein